MGEAAIAALRPSFTDDALIIWEENAPPQIPTGFEMLDQRKYGDTVITILQPAQPSA